MPEKVVEVPGVGSVSFPDSMSDDQISAVIKQQHPELVKQPSLLQPHQETGTGVLGRAGEFVRGAAAGILNPVLHPIDTLESLGKNVVMSGMAAGGQYPSFAPTGNRAIDEQNLQIKQNVQNEAVAQGKDMVQNHPAYLAGSVVGPMAAGYGLSKVPIPSLRVGSPIAETLTKARGTVPAEAATPLELKAYADANGIDINAAQATEHNFPRNIQSVGERATLGGTQVRQQTAAAQAQVAQHAQNMAEKFSPGAADAQSAGAKIQQSVQSALDNQRQIADANYKALDAKSDGVLVDVKDAKNVASQLLKSSEFVRTAGQQPSALTRTLQGIQKMPNTATFADAQQLRSALIDASSSPDLAISNAAQGMIKLLNRSVDSSMESAAKDAGILNDWRAANEHYKGIQEDFNSPRSPLNQVLNEPDPTKIPQKFMQKGQTGGSSFGSDLLTKYGIDTGPVKAAILNDMANRNFGLFQGKNVAGYNDSFLKSVFTPEELDGIYKTGAIARSVRFNANPSGTAAVNSAVSDVKNPLFSLAPKAIAAKLTNSPAFNNWLMRTPEGKAAMTSGGLPKAKAVYAAMQEQEAQTVEK